MHTTSNIDRKILTAGMSVREAMSFQFDRPHSVDPFDIQCAVVKDDGETEE